MQVPLIDKNEKPDSKTILDFKWKEYTLRVDHYKYYLTIALQVNAFFYLTAGVVFGFYLKDSPQYSLFFLLLPILIGSVFGGVFRYGAVLQEKAFMSLEKLRIELENSGLKTDELYDSRSLNLLFQIFGYIFFLVVVALIVVPLKIGSASWGSIILFLVVAVLIVIGGFRLPILACKWESSESKKQSRYLLFMEVYLPGFHRKRKDK